MTDLFTRRQILNAAADLLDRGPSALTADEFLLRAGQVYRIACTDAEASDEAADLVDQADALLERFRAEGHGLPLSGLTLPDVGQAERWLQAPAPRFAEVLETLDRVGAIKAGLALLDGARPEVDQASDRLVAQIQAATERHPEALFDLGVAALERIAERGLVPGEDAALLALDEAVQRRLTSALAGQPLEANRTFRVRPLASEQAQALGQALALAMQRTNPLAVAPDLLELAPFTAAASSRGHDLVLHGVSPRASVDLSVELMRDVRVSVHEDEIEIELLGNESGPVLLVPLVRGEPDRPCASRSGNHPRHLIFTPAPADPNLDGYALVVGDRLAFLKLARLRPRKASTSTNAGSP